MKTYDIHDKENRLFSFEVSNVLLGRNGAVKIVKSIPSVRILKAPKFFSWFREDDFCEFELAGHIFYIFEPFGDNSRYWIGSKDNIWHPEIDTIRNAFASHSVFRNALNDWITLRS